MPRLRIPKVRVPFVPAPFLKRGTRFQLRAGNDFKLISFKMVLRLFALLSDHWRPYTLVCGLGVIIASLEMIPPRLVGNAIDLMANPHFSMEPVYIILGIWTLIAACSQILMSLQIRLANKHGELALSALRERLFDHLQNLPMKFFDKTHPGRILTMTGSDVEAIRNVLIWGINTLIANSALMVLASLMIFLTDPVLFAATAWLAPAMTVVNILYGRRVTEAWQVVRRHYSFMGANQAENIAGVRVVMAFNRQKQNLKTFNELQEQNTANNVMASRKAGLFNPLLQWVKFCGVAIILVFGGYRVACGKLQAGSLVAVLLYWDWFMTPAMNFGVFYNELLIAMAGAERLFNLLDEPVNDCAVNHRAEPGGLNAGTLMMDDGCVSFQNVCFRYEEGGRAILDRVNFSVKSGSVVALVGETGSGKSTIISLLARFYHPSSGRILIDGVDLAEIGAAELRKKVAMVLQNNFLFSGSVIENLRYARPDAADAQIFAAAEALGCHNRFLTLPQGYQTDVGERGAGLSLGERQLVCFTRALLNEPRLLLLDEATSALDPVTGQHVQRALSRLVKNRTTFIVTHRISTIRRADLIIVVDQGRIAEIGNHSELIQLKGIYSSLWSNSL